MRAILVPQPGLCSCQSPALEAARAPALQSAVLGAVWLSYPKRGIAGHTEARAFRMAPRHYAGGAGDGCIRSGISRCCHTPIPARFGYNPSTMQNVGEGFFTLRGRREGGVANQNQDKPRPWLSLSLKAPIASRVGFVSLVASFPSAECNLILTRAHSGVIYMARSMEIGQKISEATRYAFACILPDHFCRNQQGRLCQTQVP